MLASDGERVLTVTTPLLPLSVNGAGDATAALFLAHLLTDGLEPRSRAPPRASSR